MNKKYRAVSLMNISLEIGKEVLASKTAILLYKTIKYQQTEFISVYMYINIALLSNMVYPDSVRKLNTKSITSVYIQLIL